MARGKKAAKELSPEETLEQALIPVKKQPYPIPENWCYIPQKIICNLSNGEKKENTEYPYWDVKCLRGTKEPDLIDSGKFIPSGTKVILVDGENSGEIFTILHDGYMGSTFRALNIVSAVFPDYLQYYVETKKELYKSNKRGSAVPHLNKELFFSTPFPLPPLSEQHRIVSRIENLFSKLDEAKEKVQAVVDNFELRKSAVLHKAFTGELTERWRKEHGVGLDSWENRTLNSVCSSIFDGDHMPPPKSESGVPFLVISNVNNGHLSYENTRFVSQEYYDSLSGTRKPQIGDVLYTLVGSYGIPVVVDDERPFCFQRHMALLKPKYINTYFLWYLLQSQEMFNKASEIATGTAQLTVPIKGLRMIEFQCPSENEQAEIVRILDKILGKEQQAKESVEAVLTQINTMKKVILARAFRGELGTNDPAEESAAELLKSTLHA